MPRGYRLIILAVGGLALLTALFLGAYFGSLYSPDQKQYQAVTRNQRGQNDYQGPSQSLPNISGLPSLVERAIANPKPATGQDHEKRDLAAQEASALWAFWIVVASFSSVIITAVGTAFLYKQIVLTREAVQGTGTATLAMQESNRIAEEIGQAQIRAYVNVAGVTISITETMLWIDVTFKNTGQSPASDVSAGFTPAIWLVGIGTPKIIEKVHFTESERSVEGGVIGSGDESNSVGTVWSFGPDDHANFHLAKEFGSTDKLLVSVLLSFHLTWLDVFGKKQSVYGVVNAGEFGSDVIAGQGAITSNGKARNEDFDVNKWVDRKNRQAGKK